MILFQPNLEETEVIEAAVSTGDNSISIFLWIAIIELLIILFLIWKLIKAAKGSQQSDAIKQNLKNAKNSKVNMGDLMDSINGGARELYKELSRKCHPDLFINTDKQLIAQDLFQEISKNKRDYKKLTELKERAVLELKVNFK
ncbi:hypothetical protein JCM19275_2221 [Nonlabens ulvanivorans]|uniref:Molecular chaperone DnaJ n=1 Tax=Nonlabens ulvanivorans TaxID=906888 RepID=A0A090WL21_NONUL|nr:hypothetical protein [Nonlabens ulvanivorans]GAL76089.1 hypothetical protein JCM19275_2221 [Nonlabens ulvanivorans]